MTKESWWKRELKEILAISSTFYVLFVLFLLMKKAVLAGYDIPLLAFGTALVGALIIGKVVLIFDKLPLTKKMDHLPKINRVIFRSLIYICGYVIFSLLEHLVKGLIGGENFSQAGIHAVHFLGELHFLTSLVAIFIAFLFFNTFWVIRNHYGPKELYKLFFKKSE